MGSPLFPNWNNKKKQDELAKEIVKAAGSAGKTPSGLKSWLSSKISGAVSKKLGLTGSLVEALLRPFAFRQQPSRKEEIEAAEEIVKHLSQPELIDPRGGTNIPTVRPVYQIGSNPPPLDDDWRIFPTDQPVLEGMIEVKSSNVHSIGYLHPGTHSGNGDMYVRYLGNGPNQTRVGEGNLYRYRDVPLSVWENFKKASSKGKEVWDSLRVRGTVAGHQYSYDLESQGPAANASVPRQAAVKRGQAGEFFIPRNFQGRRSSLPERQVRGPRGTLLGWEKRDQLKLRQTGRR